MTIGHHACIISSRPLRRNADIPWTRPVSKAKAEAFDPAPYAARLSHVKPTIRLKLETACEVPKPNYAKDREPACSPKSSLNRKALLFLINIPFRPLSTEEKKELPMFVRQKTFNGLHAALVPRPQLPFAKSPNQSVRPVLLFAYVRSWDQGQGPIRLRLARSRSFRLLHDSNLAGLSLLDFIIIIITTQYHCYEDEIHARSPFSDG